MLLLRTLLSPRGCRPTPTLRLRAEHVGHIIVLFIAVRGDFILVGDLMKSLTVYQCSLSSGTIVELARDYNSHWMTSIAFLDAASFLIVVGGNAALFFVLLVARVAVAGYAVDEAAGTCDARGAFAVRSLAGIIDRVGLLRAEHATERNIRQVYRLYQYDPDGAAARAFATSSSICCLFSCLSCANLSASRAFISALLCDAFSSFFLRAVSLALFLSSLLVVVVVPLVGRCT